MEKISFTREYTRETTTAPHEVAECVNKIGEVVTFTAKYSRGYWLKKCKGKKVYDIELLIKKMKETEAWLQTKGEKLNRGGWLTNRI